MAVQETAVKEGRLEMTPQQNAQWLDVLLEMPREAVGIHFLMTKEEYESFPADAPERRMSYCTMVRRATKGISQKAHLGHMACGGGSTALGLSKPTEAMIDGTRRMGQGAYHDLCTCRKVSKNMVYCEHHLYGVGIVPLKDCEKDPDVVIFVCNPFNAMRIMQGYAYRNGHASNICLSGMQAVCQECTSRPYELDQINISMMCSGTRMLTGWRKDELGIGVPYHMLDQIVTGLRETVNPLERNHEKREIAGKLSEHGLDGQLDIVMNKNYDDNCYVGGPAGEPGK